MADDNQKQSTSREDPKAAAARQRAAALAKAGPGMKPENIAQFFKDTWNELKKTTWPDRPTLLKSTYIVLAFIGFTAVWVGVIDAVLTDVTKGLFKS